MLNFSPRIEIASEFRLDHSVVVFPGDCLQLLETIPDNTLDLVVTSPPYNIGKVYEKKNSLANYLDSQRTTIQQCARVLKPAGSICWQVGNYVNSGEIVPLDYVLYPVFRDQGLRMRNRIVWHFEHGLHCSRRLSGRYEVIMWFTKSHDYYFDLDPIRVPQKYPGKKYFKGPNAGQYSCNPLGKNPGDLWIIPNVKSNHIEKTDHPCQFPVELIERLVLALSPPDGSVFDPYLGTGTTVIAAIRHGRKGIGAETMPAYLKIARTRIRQAIDGTLPVRPMHKPVFDPDQAGAALRTAPWLKDTVNEDAQLRLFDQAAETAHDESRRPVKYRQLRSKRSS
jgi:adenine-specific DNA-methyltransferase